jgi:hypothetical protein
MSYMATRDPCDRRGCSDSRTIATTNLLHLSRFPGIDTQIWDQMSAARVRAAEALRTRDLHFREVSCIYARFRQVPRSAQSVSLEKPVSLCASRFTTDKLLSFLKRLDRKVTIQISPHPPGEPYQSVGVGL